MAESNLQLTESRKKELREDASYFEGMARFLPILKRGKDWPEVQEAVMELVEYLDTLFCRGMYLFHYRKDFGEELYQELLRYWGLSAQDATSAIFFTYCALKIRHHRNVRRGQVEHLKLVKAEGKSDA